VRRLLPFALPLALPLFACAPDVPQNPPPESTVVAEFDPPAVVPLPNDLVPKNPTTGTLMIPDSTSDTAAQTEFNQTYLDTLSAFPRESTAQVLLSGPLNPATVTPQNVVVLDVTPPGGVVAGLTPIPDPVKNAIDVPPPAGGWTRAHTYAVALIAGPGRLTGAQGERVIGSPTWALVSSPNPLVSCPNGAAGLPDLTSSQCKPTVDVIPSLETEPQARLKDQTAKAIKLEPIRQGYAPLLKQIEGLEKFTDASHIPILWTFTIVDAGEVTFDPANGIIPFPNDVLRSNGRVTLPNPISGSALRTADCASATDSMTQLVCGLNTLDGFSTIAPPISEYGSPAGPVSGANIDPTTPTLTTKSVGLMRLASTAPPEEATAPAYTPCLNCLSSPLPQPFQWKLDAPLDERTTYLAYVTGDVKDDQGKSVIANPVFALVRLKSPLTDGRKSLVNILTDAQARQLEPLRLGLKPALDALEGAGVARKNLTLAWAFTTQSEATLLDGLYDYVRGPAQTTLPQGVVFFADATALYTGAATAASIPIAKIGKFYTGVFETPFAVTGPGGTFDLMNHKAEPVIFALAVPATPAPAAGYPITIFGHGLTRDRNDFLAIANSLAAAGQATIATDAPFHGDRTSCTGFGAFLMGASGTPTSDDSACADPTTMKCNGDPLIGRCVARIDSTRTPCAPTVADQTGNLACQSAPNQGACVPSDGKCEGGDFARDATRVPTISGWNIFSLSNFFATRDNLRQQVIDLAQLVHTLNVTGPASVATRAGVTFDLTKMGYVGQSLGGILGTLYNAVSPDTTNVVLNVPGGDLPQIILNAPSFMSQRTLLLRALAAQGIMPNTPAFDRFTGFAQWILDPADPANMGWRLTHPVSVSASGRTAPNVNRKAFIQFIEGDQTVPNFSNLALVAAAADQSFAKTMPPSFGCTPPLYCYEFTESLDGFDMTSVLPAGRHGFLLRPPSSTMQSLALTVKAQTQVATFLATGNFQ
jgi:hypothetical protein